MFLLILIILLIRYQETVQHMTREVNTLDENKRTWRPFTELRTQLTWFCACSIEEFAKKLVFAYLRGSAEMATKLLRGVIDKTTARYFENHINPAFLASKESLRNIFPVSLLVCLLLSFITYSMIIRLHIHIMVNKGHASIQ